jgi:hypothetical protein
MYCLEFIGGPLDGYRRLYSSLPPATLREPACAASLEHPPARPPKKAIYGEPQAGLFLDPLEPMVVVRYRFLGFALPRPTVRQRWDAFSSGLVRRLHRLFLPFSPRFDGHRSPGKSSAGKGRLSAGA